MQTISANTNRIYLGIIFLISPVIGFAFSIKNFFRREFRIFIFFFLILFSYTYIPIPDSDGDKYRVDYIHRGDYTFSNYVHDVKAVFEGTAPDPDFYINTVRFVSFSLYGSYKLFFVILGLVYYSVVLRFISKIWNYFKVYQHRYFLSFFVGCCFIWNMSSGLNGIRFPLAFWVFSFGAFNYLITDKPKFLLMAGLSVLIHFSLTYSMLFLVIFYFVRNGRNNTGLYMFLGLAVIISTIFLSLISNYVGFLGGSFENKVSAYTTDYYIEKREQHLQSLNWYVQFNYVGGYYFCIASLLLSRFAAFRLKFTRQSDRFFRFSMIMLIHSILSGAVVDSISNRYYLMVNLFTLLYLLHLGVDNPGNRFLKLLRNIHIPIVVISILIIFRIDLSMISPILTFGNIISIFTTESAISLQDYLLT